MQLYHWCIAIVTFMPYVWVALAKSKFSMSDFADPRPALNKLTGWRKRAYYLQNNSFEAVPMFALATLIASKLQVPSDTINTLAISFIFCRLVHAACYLKNLPRLRALAWFAGIGCNLGLFLFSC